MFYIILSIFMCMLLKFLLYMFFIVWIDLRKIWGLVTSIYYRWYMNKNVNILYILKEKIKSIINIDEFIWIWLF